MSIEAQDLRPDLVVHSHEGARPRRATEDLDQLAINTIRTLAIDAVEAAGSGHPGTPMALAPLAYVLWTRFLRHDPVDPAWADRDRFVLSAGHASMLLYATLHLAGYDLPLEELRRFRQWGSHCPGHPERGVTPGVEVTTGPLGQGFANAVGMAVAERMLARFNRPGHEIVDHAVELVASGSEVHLALGARRALEAEGISARVVSMPSSELFEAQPDAYRDVVLTPGRPRLAVEAGRGLGWCAFADEVVSLERFGASAPAAVLFREFGFTAERVAARARALTQRGARQ